MSEIGRTERGPEKQEIEITAEAKALLEAGNFDVTDMAVLEAVAFRVGDPAEWEQAEANFQVASRMCRLLGVSLISDDMRAVSIHEGDRQKELFQWAEDEKFVQEQRRELVARTERNMGPTATLLVEIFLSPDDPRDRDAVRAQVLRALEPIQIQSDDRYYEQVIRR